MQRVLREIWEYAREVGNDPAMVIGGGGNASVKIGAHLWIKASGYAMGTMPPEGFVCLDHERVLAVLAAGMPAGDRAQADACIAQALLDARVNPPRADIRPSVEAMLHAVIPCRFVMHTHPEIVSALTSAVKGKAAAARLNLPPYIWVEYVDPGMPLALRVRRALAAAGAARPRVVFMAKHGFLAGGDSVEEVKRLTGRVLAAIRRELMRSTGRRAQAAAFGPVAKTVIAPERWDAMRAVAVPAVRGALAQARQVVLCARSKDVDRALGGARARAITTAGPLCPDQVVYCGAAPLFVRLDPGAAAPAWQRTLRAEVAAYRTRFGCDPRVILVPGLGVMCIGRTHAYAQVVRDLYLQALRVMARCRVFGGVRTMTRKEYGYIAQWAMEDYRRALAERGGPAARAAGRVAVVTGSAQGVGREIAEGLAAHGAHVVLCDVNAAGAADAAAAIVAVHGADRAVGLAADVTDEASMRRVMHTALDRFGGLDLVVANAGILQACKVTEFPLAAWRRIVDVNLTGAFVCAKTAAEVMRWQGWGDVIQINSKSGKRGSKYNAAYAASKFGGIGLVQSIALDLIEDGIKVNAICPGNFFDLPLWSASGGLFDQYRAKFGNVPREEVRRIYEAQIPLGRGCTVPDVIAAILYIVEQAYETGQAYNVTGGQEMR